MEECNGIFIWWGPEANAKAKEGWYYAIIDIENTKKVLL